MRGDRKSLTAFCGFLFGFAFLVWGRSFQNQFLYGDDQNIITNNLYLRDWRFLPEFFTKNYVAGAGINSNYYRPMQTLIDAVIMHTVGSAPWAFHLAVLALHGLCGVLMFLLILELLPNEGALFAALATAVWMAHPLHASELAVNVGVASPGYTAGMIGALLLFRAGLKRRETPTAWTAAALSVFVVSLGFKESAIVLPALIAGAHWLYRRTRPDVPSALGCKNAAALHAPFWLVAGGYFLLRLTWLNFGGTLNFYGTPNFFTDSLPTRLYTLATALAGGLFFMAVPSGLHPERSWPIFANPFLPPVILSVTTLIGAIAVAIAKRRTTPTVTFGIFWFFACYAPFSNLLAKISAVFQDHWLYAPSIGVVIALAAFLRTRDRKVVGLSAAILALTFGFVSFNRLPRWRTPLSYSSELIREEPGLARVWTNYGISLMDQRMFPQAAAAFQRTIALQDAFPQSHHDLARTCLAMNQPAQAEAEYLRALKMDPDFYYSRVDLARLYLQMGRKSEALTQLLALQKKFPEDAGLQRTIASLGAAPKR